MTTTATAPPDVPAALRDRLRRGQTPDQLVKVGERTGWWTEADVDAVVDGATDDDDNRLAELEDELAARRVIAEPVEPPAVASDVNDPPLADWEAALVAPDPMEAIADTAGDTSDGQEFASSAYTAVIQARELGVDHSYQRSLDEPRVARMVAAWDPRMVGTIDVSDRGEGEVPRYAVINGQHRAAAAARVSPAGGDVWLACTVHEGLDVAGEARLMHELDRTTKKLSGWDKWHARRGSGDPIVVKVEEIAARHGLTVDNNPVDGSLRSYGAAEKLLQRGGEQLLDSALGILHAAYGHAFQAYQAPMVTGVGSLLQVFGATVDVERLTRALRGIRPEQLRAAATALRDVESGALNELMTRAMAGQYNRTPGSGPRLGGRS